MNDYELTDEEGDGLDAEGLEFFTRKKLLAYLCGNCTELHHTDVSCNKRNAWIARRRCPDCIVALLKAHGIEAL